MFLFVCVRVCVYLPVFVRVIQVMTGARSPRAQVIGRTFSFFLSEMKPLEDFNRGIKTLEVHKAATLRKDCGLEGEDENEGAYCNN